MDEVEFQKRIGWTGDITVLLKKVCEEYQLDEYISHSLVQFGYEDYNLILNTKKSNYFIKVFASFREKKDCERYISVITHILELGVAHPKLLRSNNRNLYETEIEGVTIRLCVMDYIDGDSFYTLGIKPSKSELKFLIKHIALTNASNMHPPYLYDSWAIVNFVEEYKKKAQHLTIEDKDLLLPLFQSFQKINIENLPHSLVHGDIIKTNVMKTTKEDLYIIDFSVSNYYPRIVELAVLCNSMFFDEGNIQITKEYYLLALEEYQKYIHLTTEEIELLPLFIKVGHAMHILCANYEKVVNNNQSKENEYWLQLGRIGLQFSREIF